MALALDEIFVKIDGERTTFGVLLITNVMCWKALSRKPATTVLR